MFMACQVVQALHKKSHNIEVLVHKKRFGRVLLRHRQYAVVSPPHVGLLLQDMHGQIIHGKGITLNKDEWGILLAKLPTLAMCVAAKNTTWQYKLHGQWHFGCYEDIANVDAVRVIDSPKIEDVVSWMYMYLLRQGVLLGKCADCIGCNIRNPQGLQAHTCQQPWHEAIEKYTLAVVTRLDEGKDAMESMFTRVLGELDMLPPFSVHGVFKKMMRSHGLSYLMKTLRMYPADDNRFPEYVELFNRLRYHHV